MKATKFFNVPLDVKTLTEKGEFEGYGSVFNVVDLGGDIVAPGAFTKSLAEHAANDTMPAMLWQHRTEEPIGVYAAMVEDKKGLYVKGELILETQRGMEAYHLLKRKALRGLSIGYSTVQSTRDEQSRIRTLKEIDLWEVSPVTFAMNPEAGVDHVKTIKTERDFERFLRDVGGYSRSQATAIALHGFKAAELRDAEADEPGDVLESMRRFAAAMSPTA